MPNWLVVSIVLSIVLTVAVNVFFWLFPGAGRGIGDSIERLAENVDRRDADRRATQRGDHARVRVIVPWKAMLIGSLVLTVAINLFLLIAR
jgi:hypothetical protein